MDRTTEVAAQGLLLKVPAGGQLAKVVSFSNPHDTLMGEYWQSLGPHVTCAVCWRAVQDEMNRLIEERGIYSSPAGPASVPVARVRSTQDELNRWLYVGCCQACGTGYWAPDVTPSEEELQRHAQAGLLAHQRREHEHADGVRREKAQHALCERKGHDWRGPQELVRWEQRRKLVEEGFRCERCGAQRPVLPTDRRK